MDKDTLTANERTYVHELTRIDSNRPRTKIEAYERAYSTGGTRQTRQAEASRVLARPRVKAAIEAAEKKIEDDRRRMSRGTVSQLQTVLWEMVREAERDSDRIAAIRTLISILPKNTLEAEINPKDSALSKSELMDRLGVLLEESLPSPIDVTPAIEDDTSEMDIIEAQATRPPPGVEDDSEPEY
jgi:hypothetical protein